MNEGRQKDKEKGMKCQREKGGKEERKEEMRGGGMIRLMEEMRKDGGRGRRERRKAGRI